MRDDFNPRAASAPLWVFAYGSLIWNPEFPVAERRLGRAHGWRRSFCMWSIHHRGTETEPGLVLALDRDDGADCAGVVLRVEPGAEAQTLAALRERELISSAYDEAVISVTTEAGPVTALAYVVNRDHVQYCGNLDLEAQAEVIARAVGGRGANRDYLLATASQLEDLGIADPELRWLSTRVRSLR